MLEPEFNSDLTKDGEIDKYNVIVTAYSKNDDTLVISLFPIEQWDMVTSTALSLDMTVEDIIRGLGPDEVVQHEISSDDWNEFFVENDLLDDDDDYTLPDDDEDIF